MNDYGFIDYQRPTAKQNDYRTSTYRGNIHLVEQILPRPAGELANVCRFFLRDPSEEQSLKSEIQEKYTVKAPDPSLVRNPTVKGVQFMKPFEEIRLRNAPKPLPYPGSVFRRDYKYKPKPYEESPPVLNMQNAVRPNAPLLIIRGKPGYAKYLDPSSTTTNLDYVPKTVEQLAFAARDNITYWNWNKQRKNVFKIKQTQCDKFRSAECIKRRAEFATQVKCVPNNGMTSEYLTNFPKHSRVLDFDITHIKNKLMSAPEPPMKADTENQIYGSGRLVSKYVA